MSGQLGWRRWVEQAVGRGARVVASRRLRGGITSVVHAIDLVDAGGVRHRLVLRRYPPNGPVAPGEAGPLADAEVVSLGHLGRWDIRVTPRLVAADRDGDTVGQSAVLSTRLPGRPLVAPANEIRWAEQLAAQVLALLESLGNVDGRSLRRYEPWHDVGPDGRIPPPDWMADRSEWHHATARIARARPQSALPLQAIHRDLHPGNLLWSHGEISGVVDWVHLCFGPVEDDIARCRLNVWLLAGRTAAERFLQRVEGGGIAYDRQWDVAVLADMAPHLDGVLAANRIGASLSPELVRRRALAILRQ